MRAGTLRHRVTLKAAARETPNEFGEANSEPVQVSSNTLGGTWWASVEPVSGTETDSAHQTQAMVTHQIRMRYSHTLRITPSWRVEWQGRVFEVVSVQNVGERDRETVILAREMVGHQQYA